MSQSFSFLPDETISLTIPVVYIEKAKDRALRSGVSINDYLAAALMEYMAKPANNTLAELTTSFYSLYQSIKRDTGFSNVMLADVLDAMQCEKHMLHAMLATESKKGCVVLSTGDWSLASERERQASMKLGCTIRLYVRVKGDAS